MYDYMKLLPELIYDNLRINKESIEIKIISLKDLETGNQSLLMLKYISDQFTGQGHKGFYEILTTQ